MADGGVKNLRLTWMRDLINLGIYLMNQRLLFMML
jgi:hypothetical protein